MVEMNKECPACFSGNTENFYFQQEIPTNSCVLFKSKEQALNCRKGDLELKICHNCGLIFNSLFEPDTQKVDREYESSQSFSGSFNTFANSLAGELIEKYSVERKNIIEIGCGRGEFLELICDKGQNTGVGIDPLSDGKQNEKGNVTYLKEYYSPTHMELESDLICCRHTLEHIQNCGEFVKLIRHNLNGSNNTVVFFEVPDVERILEEGAFWDVYYEHCNYFTVDSLEGLFVRIGFRPVEIYKAYDGQYIISIFKPSEENAGSKIKARQFIEQKAEDYESKVEENIDRWRGIIENFEVRGDKTVIWGASSKTVGFLSALGIKDEIEICVDINPYKQGMYVPGTGQKIVKPRFLKKYKPDKVIIMNPVYYQEIKKDLENMGLSTHLLCV